MTYEASHVTETKLVQPTDVSSNTLRLTFSQFDLECDHDSVTVLMDSDIVWQGGCQRQHVFTVDARSPDGDTAGLAVTVRITSDNSIQGAGIEFNFQWFLSVATTSVLSVGSPAGCPGQDFPCTALANGACMVTGHCVCNPGYIGEDCSAHQLCPGPLCTQAKSDAMASSHKPGGVVVVAPWGSDIDGTGWVGDAVSSNGTVPKPLASLASALAVVSRGGTILMYPGVYRKMCGRGLSDARLSISTASIAGAATHQAEPTVFDCSSSGHPFLSMYSCDVSIHGVQVRGSRNSGVVVHGGRVEMSHVQIVDCASPWSGGGISVSGGAELQCNNVGVVNASAPAGGGIFVGSGSVLAASRDETSSAALTTHNCTADKGGGLYCDRCTVMGFSSSRIYVENAAATHGGGIYARGNAALSWVHASSNVATAYGGGVAIEGAANITMTHLDVSNNVAASSGTHGGGGGIWVGGVARVSLVHTQVMLNVASRGGGVKVAGAGTSIVGLNFTVSSNCATWFGGGVSINGEALVSTVLIADNTVQDTCGKVVEFGSSRGGGGIAVEGGSVSMNEVVCTRNSVHTTSWSGGGCVLVLPGASLTTIDTSITGNSIASGIGGGVLLLESSTFTGATSAVAQNTAIGCGAGVGMWSGSTLSHIHVNSNVVFPTNNATAPSGGGGVCVLASDSVLTEATLSHLTVSNNHAQTEGGGLWVGQSAAVRLVQSRIQGNGAEQGSGVFLATDTVMDGTSTSVIVNNAPYPASAHSIGGGVLCSSCAHVTSINVDSNAATLGGGVAVVHAAGQMPTRSKLLALVVSNCTAIDGGGLFVGPGARLEASQVQVTGNSAEHHGGGAFVHNGSLITVSIREPLPSFPWFATTYPSRRITLLVSNNTALRGGGVGFDSGVVSRGACTFCLILVQGNTATFGGGIFAADSFNITAVDSVVVYDNSAYSGAGMSVHGDVLRSSRDVATTRIQECEFVLNKARHSGGGVHLANASVSMHDTVVKSNTATYGGGVAAIRSHLRGSGIVLLSNLADVGGGLATHGSMATGSAHSHWLVISNCSASLSGGGVAVFGEDAESIVHAVKVTACTATRGGGIAMVEGGQAHLSAIVMSRCSTQLGHTASCGGGMFVDTTATASIEYSVVDSCNSLCGGGVCVYGNATVRHVVVESNDATRGGGILVQDGGRLAVVNGTWSRNKAAVEGGGLFARRRAVVNVAQSLLIDNVAMPSLSSDGSLFHESLQDSRCV